MMIKAERLEQQGSRVVRKLEPGVEWAAPKKCRVRQNYQMIKMAEESGLEGLKGVQNCGLGAEGAALMEESGYQKLDSDTARSVDLSSLVSHERIYILHRYRRRQAR
jgi:hypothetical protein